jgi:hypothetical protein
MLNAMNAMLPPIRTTFRPYISLRGAKIRGETENANRYMETSSAPRVGFVMPTDSMIAGRHGAKIVPLYDQYRWFKGTRRGSILVKGARKAYAPTITVTSHFFPLDQS